MTVTKLPLNPRPPYLVFAAPINQQTAKLLKDAITQAQANGAQQVYLGLSTPGGLTTVALELYHWLKRQPVDVVTHNLSTVQSAGNILFLAGCNRYANPAATFYFHEMTYRPKHGRLADAADLRRAREAIEQQQEAFTAVYRECTKLKEAEIEDLFGTPITQGTAWAKRSGIIQDVFQFVLPDHTNAVHIIQR